MQILVVMALASESQGLLEKAGFSVLYTGMGKVQASLSLTKHLSQSQNNPEPLLVVNLGTAGSFKLAPGQVVEVQRVVQRDVDLRVVGLPAGRFPKQLNEFICSSYLASCQRVVCGTGDSVISQPALVDCDVMDMECFALAQVAAHFGVSFCSYKYISDASDSNTLVDWRASLHSAAAALTQVAIQLRDRMVAK